MARTLARRLSKVAYFLLILFVIGRSLGDPYLWVNHDLGYWVVHLFYGNEDAGVENIEDVFFYIAFITEIAATTAIYLITMKLIRKIRSK
ncbi:hypothetical protein RJ492_006071 [Pluralibacter gergoviae]|uniref:Uncharacterized protein n=1 Tax=Pluralibacter gergoviae TaxID=61647 RepID=A0AAI9GLW2_PLUGE|nr:hypothetical protein [Pluralibacter gergoviae]EKV0917854.1 hypothetical protein [Pluralibacter gergoviae]EKV0933017.1 hypothetical protein [Pluralibacter gergoviae]EKV6250134.1 hypothetical protein [Pluralibacter gergoviae]EKV9910559.1 hypothetical protein [Pluralibacter gergoviae]EKW6620424.1 hypothetical protein [Pluralibacter gergoviae]